MTWHLAGHLSGRLAAALAIFAVMALVPPVALAVGDPFLVVIASRMLVLAIAALSLDLILGYGAMVSFGHAAYLGFGAYAVALGQRWGVSDLLAQILLGMAMSAVFAGVTGAISLRTRGVYFIMITLAFAQMAYFFFVAQSSLGGDDGVSLAARSTLLGWTLEGDLSLYYVILGALVLIFAGLYRLTGARFGRVLIGTRENALRMQAIGFRPFRYQLAAYVIAACLCSVAGVLLANLTQYVSPAYMGWHRSGELIVMLVFGGIGTLSGAVAGALVAVGLEELLAAFSEHWRLGFGLALVLVVLFSPDGLTGLAKKLGVRRE